MVRRVTESDTNEHARICFKKKEQVNQCAWIHHLIS